MQLHDAQAWLARRSAPLIDLPAYSLTDPKGIPWRKYRCASGKRRTSGKLAMTCVAGGDVALIADELALAGVVHEREYLRPRMAQVIRYSCTAPLTCSRSSSMAC